ncbi:sialate O-acetylesterase [Bacteroides sp.]|uniref:sialate O-acetylesterase n=1 Tax=Bacteroides sp. TaxID=29523 RepID=UPI0025C1999D|nr:sialate O-acetylesterase [Bacteroides sp.]
MKRHFLILAFSLLFLPFAQGKVKLPAMMGNHMVLQQNSSVKLWGWADGKKVTVTTSWNNRTYQASVEKDGAWLVKVDTPAGGYTPYSITISDGTPVTLSDILIGEVWICSGQSNMEMRMMGNSAQPIDNSLETLLNAGNYRDRIRFITVPRAKTAELRTDFEGKKWEMSAPETTIDCSAAAYFFARQLTESLHLPVGLVISSWGGSRIEAWMDEQTLASIEGVDMEAAKSSKRDIHQRLGCLYNSMLCPVKNFTARGFLWYQGESNRGYHQFYAPMMTAMVQLWRNMWEAPDMPFYYVQIAPYRYENSRNIDGALLREAQMEALKTIPNSGIVPTTDIGDEFCIHPSQKNIVGLRLATLALTKTYGIGRLPSNGPMMTKVDYSDSKAIVTFDNAPAGLFPTFSQLDGFEIAGADKKFYPAKAKIVGRTNTVEVWSEEVAQPVAVRYAFRNYAGNITLRNTFGLSAFPFRTDTWDEVK